LTKKLIIASAGAGKTHRLVTECIKQNKLGYKTLIITYTNSNQIEISQKYKELGGNNKRLFVVKGWYSFLLEELVRPYQLCLFKKRINNIFFNSSNPHRVGKVTKKGTAEQLADGTFNPKHFLTIDGKKAHTEFLAKLATRIMKTSKNAPLTRLESIYSDIYFDEVQDLSGWDFDVIKALSKSKVLKLTGVGDFRQTIYSTTSKPKKPSQKSDKLDSFKKMGFIEESMASSRRSIQSICDFSDKVHVQDGYEKTVSKVTNVLAVEHLGVFFIKASQIQLYLHTYSPIVLRHSSSVMKDLDFSPYGIYTYGTSKGLGFDRTLIIPTTNYEKYILGDDNALNVGKTDTAKNKLYVAITRARYSVAFVIDDCKLIASKLPVWEP
jgi:DNA helicase-2/ATP-dependent DNA helicase PcrA